MDEALIRRAQGGDATSFAELLDLHYDTIYRFAWKWCGHAANAEDIAQLACMKLATSLAQYRFQAAFTSWLYRLVISCAQDWQRSQQRHDHDELPDEEAMTESPRHEDGIYLAQVLAQLGETRRGHEGNRVAGARGGHEPRGGGRRARRFGIHDFLARAHDSQTHGPAAARASLAYE